MTQQKNEQSDQPDEYYRHGRRHRHGFLFGFTGGVFIILLGILLFLANQGILAWDKWWQYLILGLGVILLIESLIPYKREGTRGFRIERLIMAIILIGVGVAFLLGNVTWWPVVIIIVGVAIIIGRLIRPGRTE